KTDWQTKPPAIPTDNPAADITQVFPFLFFVLVVFFCWYLIHHVDNGSGPGSGAAGRRGGRSVFLPVGGWAWGSSDWGRGGGVGGGFGGGFSGGGGSSGGGGASGSW